MPIRYISAVCGAILLAFAASASAAAGPINVHVRIEGGKRTLVSERTVTLADAPVVKDGNPDHGCPGQSALGALQQGSEGAWDGSYSEGLGYFVSAIKGEKPSGNDFFDLWINHKEATAGFCDEMLKTADSVLIFRQTCVYDPTTQQCPDEIAPLGVRSPVLLKRGKRADLTVVSYKPTGKASPEAGATVFANGKKLGKTDKHGQISVAGTKPGKVKVYATESGYAKSETDTILIRK